MQGIVRGGKNEGDYNVGDKISGLSLSDPSFDVLNEYATTYTTTLAPTMIKVINKDVFYFVNDSKVAKFVNRVLQYEVSKITGGYWLFGSDDNEFVGQYKISDTLYVYNKDTGGLFNTYNISTPVRKVKAYSRSNVLFYLEGNTPTYKSINIDTGVTNYEGTQNTGQYGYVVPTPLFIVISDAYSNTVRLYNKNTGTLVATKSFFTYSYTSSPHSYTIPAGLPMTWCGVPDEKASLIHSTYYVSVNPNYDPLQYVKELICAYVSRSGYIYEITYLGSYDQNDGAIYQAGNFMRIEYLSTSPVDDVSGARLIYVFSGSNSNNKQTQTLIAAWIYISKLGSVIPITCGSSGSGYARVHTISYDNFIITATMYERDVPTTLNQLITNAISIECDDINSRILVVRTTDVIYYDSYMNTSTKKVYQTNIGLGNGSTTFKSLTGGGIKYLPSYKLVNNVLSVRITDTTPLLTIQS